MSRLAVVVACALALTSCAPEVTTAPSSKTIVQAATEDVAVSVHREDGYIGSAACAACHRREHSTWHRTYHRTMTQHPHPEAVLGAFDGRELSHGEARVRVAGDAEQYFMELSDGATTRRADVALVVGSHRYQQYFERVERKDGERLERLPFLWHVEEERWLHLNTVFLGPDDVNPERHRALWNVNCVFCHNTGPRPGIHDATTSAADAQFDSMVAEVGIACEACHGPGAEHVATARAHENSGSERGSLSTADIVLPVELDAERELAVCGQCHGQRLPEPISNITRYLTSGPTYRPGALLEAHVTPVRRETPSPSSTSPDLFRDRFWNDGTPRLTAYEYQGVVQSACHDGGLTCSSCHTMHGGNPDGMIEDAMRGTAACADCHAEIVAEPEAHTHHAAGGAGSNCYDCHMPHVTYGVLGIRRSHRIEVPDIARDVRAQRPNACTLCHVDFTAADVLRHERAWWGKEGGTVTPDGIAHAIQSLHGGDPVQRAVYAAAFGRDGADTVRKEPALASHLAVICGDGYPSLRFLARKSLLDLGLGVDIVRDWDTTDPAMRRAIVAALLGAMARLERTDKSLLLDSDGLMLKQLQTLLESQSDKVIDIGE